MAFNHNMRGEHRLPSLQDLGLLPHKSPTFSSSPPLLPLQEPVPIQQHWSDPTRLPTPSDSSASTCAGSTSGTRPSSVVPQGKRKRRDDDVEPSTKNQNEKRQRKNLQVSTQWQEDIMTCVLRLDCGQPQSKGNAKSSGLIYNKQSILASHAGVSAVVFSALRQQAIKRNMTEELRGYLQRVADKCMPPPDCDDYEVPQLGTLMDAQPGDDTRSCDHIGNDVGCIVHNHRNWTACRKERVQRNIDINESRFRLGGQAQEENIFDILWS